MAKSLSQIRAENPQYKDLSDHELAVGLYNQYYSDKMSPQEFNQAIGYTPKASAMDYVRKLGAGAGAIEDAVGYVAGKLGAYDTKNALYDAADSTRDYWNNKLTPAGKYVANNHVFDRNADGSLGFGETPIQSGLMGVAESAAPMIATAPIGGVIGAGAKGLMGTAAAAEGVGAVAGAVARYSPRAASMIESAAAKAPGALAGAITEGGQAALTNAAQTEQEILDPNKTPQSVLEQSKAYQDALASTGNIDAARRVVAQQAADDVASKTMLSTGGIGLVTGGGVLGTMANKWLGKGSAEAAHVGAMGVAKGLAKEAGTEAGQEFLQSGAEQYIQDAAKQNYVDNSIDPNAGVLQASLEGAAVGGLMGVGGGAISHVGNKHIGTNPHLVAAQYGQQAHDAVMAASHRALVDNPAYLEELSRTGDAEAARENLARSAGIDAATKAYQEAAIFKKDINFGVQDGRVTPYLGEVPESAPAKPLQLQNNPDPLISYRDGTVGRKSDFDSYLNSLPENQRAAAQAKLLGLAPQPLDAPVAPPTAAPQDDATLAAISNQNIANFSQKRAPVSLSQAQATVEADKEQGHDFVVAPHASGQGFIVVPSQWLSPNDKATFSALQQVDSGMLPSPGSQMPNGRMIAGQNGIRPETYSDNAESRAAAQKRLDLGAQTPRGQGVQSAPAPQSQQVAQAPAQAPTEKPKKPSELTDDELTKRAEYIQTQKQLNGASKQLALENAAVKREIEKRNKGKKTLAIKSEPSFFDNQADANRAAMKAAEATNQVHEVVDHGGKFSIRPLKEENDSLSGNDSAAGSVPAAQKQSNLKGGSADTQQSAVQSGAGAEGNIAVDGQGILNASKRGQKPAKLEKFDKQEFVRKLAGWPLAHLEDRVKTHEEELRDPENTPEEAKLAKLRLNATKELVRKAKASFKSTKEIEQQDAAESKDVGGADDSAVDTETQPAEKPTQAVEDKAQEKPSNNRNSITFERATASNDVEKVTLSKGDYVDVSKSGGKEILHSGEVEGISHAKKEVKVGGQWHDVMKVSNAEKPEEITPKKEALSKVIDSSNKKTGSDLVDTDRVDHESTPEDKGEEEGKDAAFSRTPESEEIPSDKQLSVGSIVDHVDQLIEPFKSSVPVVVLDSPNDMGRGEYSDVVAQGATFDGKIYLFRNGLGSMGDVTRTLWHEMLHFGLRKFLTKDQYIEKMGDLYRTDAWIARRADAWIAGEEGKNLRKGGASKEYLVARGADEALASLAEILQTEPTGYRNNSRLAKIKRAVSNWVADLASAFGFDEAAKDWRSYAAQNNARDLIAETFSKLKANESSDHVRFSVNGGALQGMVAADLEKSLSSVIKSWKNAPPLEVVQHASDMPKDVRDEIGAANLDRVGGIYHLASNKVYLVGDNLSSSHQAAFTLLHEVMGHHGLRGVFGDKLDKYLSTIYATNKDIREKADAIVQSYKESGINLSKTIAVEEVLSDMAGTGIVFEKSFIHSLISKIRSMLRQLGFNIKFTDDDILSMLAASRKYVMEGSNKTESQAADAKESNDQSPVVNLWRAIASQKGGFMTGKTSATELGKAIKDVYPEVAFTVEKSASMEVPKENRKAAGYVVYDSNYNPVMKVFDAESDRPFIEIGNENVGIGRKIGSLYQAIAGWANNNGKTLRVDPRGLSPINELRRSEHIISAMLKYDNGGIFDVDATQFAGLLNEQDYKNFVANGKNDYNKEKLEALKREYWGTDQSHKTSEELTNARINNLAIASAALAKRRAPKEFENANLDSKGNVRVRNPDGTVDVLGRESGRLAAAKSLSYNSGVGYSVRKRAFATLQAVYGGTIPKVVDGGSLLRANALQSIGQKETPDRSARSGELHPRQDALASSGNIALASRVDQASIDESRDVLKMVNDGSTKEWRNFFQDYLRNKGEQAAQSMIRGLLGRGQRAEIYRKSLPSLWDAHVESQKLEGRARGLMEESDVLARQWSKLDNKNMTNLADVMATATTWGIHPDKPMPANLDPNDKSVYDRLRKTYNGLSDDAKKTYHDAKALFEKRAEQTQKALIDRIGRMEIPDGSKRSAIKMLQEEFDTRMGTPYFPLSRFGEWVLSATNQDDEKIVQFHESPEQARLAAAELLKRKWNVTPVHRMMLENQNLGADSSKFVEAVMAHVEAAPIDLRDEILDELNQLYIRTLPGASSRKHFIHRKNIAGFSEDALRGFAKAQAGLANQIAKLEHQDIINKLIDKADKEAMDDAENSAELSSVVNAERENQQFLAKHKMSEIAARMTSFGYLWGMAGSISSGAVNLTQTLIGMAYLGGKYKKGNAPLEVVRAGRQLVESAFIKGADDKYHMDIKNNSKLTPKEKAAITYLADTLGKLDFTLSMELMSLTSQDNLARGAKAYSKTGTLMKLLGAPMHYAERFNRVATGLASYRLAVNNGFSHEEAINHAAQDIDKTQFDLSIGARAGVLQGDTARVLLLFKSYSHNLSFLLGRSMYHAIGGGTAQENKQARGFLLRLFALQTMLAGVSTLPLTGVSAGLGAYAVNKVAGKYLGKRGSMAVGAVLGTAMWAAFAAGLGGGDDGEPWDWEWELSQFLKQFGSVGEALDKGLPYLLLGTDITQRVSMNDLWFKAPRDTNNDGKIDFAEMFMPYAGAVIGQAGSVYQGTQLMTQGHVERGVETMMPVAVKNIIKAGRFAEEDNRTVKGEKKNDVSDWGVILQTMGFQPAENSAQGREFDRIKEVEQYWTEHKTDLRNSWVSARLEGDTEKMQAIEEKIRAFNQNVPDHEKLKRDTLNRSYVQRKKRLTDSDNGKMNKRDARAAAFDAQS